VTFWEECIRRDALDNLSQGDMVCPLSPYDVIAMAENRNPFCVIGKGLRREISHEIIDAVSPGIEDVMAASIARAVQETA
jgi:hypothetical protein